MFRRLALPLALVAALSGCGNRAPDASSSRDSNSVSVSAVPTTKASLPNASSTAAERVGVIGATSSASVSAPSAPTVGAVAADDLAIRPNPLRVRARSAGIDVALDLLSMTPSKELEVPKDPTRAGWWRSAKKQSPIVLVGHVDSLTGPAVFYRVRDMKRGDDIVLTLSDGSTQTFVVTLKEQFRKDSFPTDSVYRAGSGELRLVTCGGSFNRRSRHYVDNVVVFARPV